MEVRKSIDLVYSVPTSPVHKSVSKKFAINARKIFKKRIIPHRKKSILKCLSSKYSLIFFLLPTFYLLFIDDIIGASGAQQTNALILAVGILKFITFVVFLVEMLLSMYAKGRDYIISILCLLDLVSLVSLIPDLLDFLFGTNLDLSLYKLSLARVARAARLATRIARMGKVIDLLSWTKRKKYDIHAPMAMEPSRVGYRLNARTTTKVYLYAQVPHNAPNIQLR
jgi:hypothetical protein